MGIPLQLRLLAEGFKDKFKEFIEAKDNNTSDFDNLDILSIYKHFVDGKYNIYYKEKTGLSGGFSTVSQKWFTELLTKRHWRLAFKELFDDKTAEFLGLKSPFLEGDLKNKLKLDSEQLEELRRVGLIQFIQDDHFEFIHKTLAEYFVASLLISRIDRKIYNPLKYTLTKQFLLKEMFKDSNEVISNFIDRMLGKDSPIHIATLSSNLSEVNNLLSESKNIEVTDSLGRTALHLAAQKGHIKIVNALLKSGHDTLKPDVFNKTSLHYAARYGNSDVVKRLAEYNKDIDINDNIFKSPLQIDVEVGGSIFKETEYAQSKLIKFINQHDDDDKSSLYYAAEKKDWNVACMLLLYGADSNALTKENKKELLLYTAGKTHSAYADQYHKLRPIVGLLLIKVPDAVHNYSEGYDYPRLLSYFFVHGHIKVIDALLSSIEDKEKIKRR